MFSGPNKGPIGGERPPTNPMDSAKWSVELKIMFEASNQVLPENKIFFVLKINRFVSENRGI